MLGKCLRSSHAAGCNPPHGKELRRSHFHFCNLLFLQMYLVLGRTDIHMHKKASTSFLPKSAHAVSSPYIWVQCFRQPKPIVHSAWTSNYENHSQHSEQQLGAKPHVHRPAGWSPNYSNGIIAFIWSNRLTLLQNLAWNLKDCEQCQGNYSRAKQLWIFKFRQEPYYKQTKVWYYLNWSLKSSVGDPFFFHETLQTGGEILPSHCKVNFQVLPRENFIKCVVMYTFCCTGIETITANFFL